MIGLPERFQFSQASLQDFVDCPRRFELRYVLHRRWPALETQPALESERRMRRGAEFHRLIHRDQIGIPRERLAATVDDPSLETWWQRYLSDSPPDLPRVRYPEQVLSVPLAGFRLLARYDLLALIPGERAVIVDWKTGSPQREGWLRERLQTRVYPYVLVRAGAELNDGRAVLPRQVEMVYWYAEAPDSSVLFPYTEGRYEEDEAYLGELIERILETPVGHFVLTSDENRCKVCRYRSLCNRGRNAGHVEDAEGEGGIAELLAEDELASGLDIDLDLDFGQIAEAEY